VFWVISVYFNIRNTLPKSGTFLLGHPVYAVFGYGETHLLFGPKKDEVTGGCRKLQNEELRDLYSSPSVITIIKSKRMKWAGHVARMGGKTNAYRLLVGKSEGRRPLG
jgi:hypothetical protein